MAQDAKANESITRERLSNQTGSGQTRTLIAMTRISRDKLALRVGRSSLIPRLYREARRAVV